MVLNRTDAPSRVAIHERSAWPSTPPAAAVFQNLGPASAFFMFMDFGYDRWRYSRS